MPPIASSLRFLYQAQSAFNLWWLLWILVAVLSLSLFYLPPALQQLWFYGTGEWLLLLLIADAARKRSAVTSARARHGWMLISLAMMIWLSSALLGAVAELLPLTLPLWLLEDVGYLFYYVVLNSMLSSSQRHTSLRFENAFILMLFGYMILLPVLLVPAEYESFKPSTAFYLCMDLYLLQRAMLFRRAMGLPVQEFGLVLLILSMIFAGDLLNTLMLLNWLPNDAAHPVAGLYFLPMLLVALFLKLTPRPDVLCDYATVARQSRAFDWIIFVCLPCLIHLSGYLIFEFEPELREVRDLYLCCWLVCVAVLFLWQQSLAASQVMRPADLDPAPKLQTATRSELLDKLDLALEKRIGQTNLRLADIAEDLHMQPRQLQRKLTEHCALTPEQYWLNWRLQRAAELLAQGHKVSYVVIATGFSQQSHFTRRFKDKFGVTPGEYAKSGSWTDKYKKYHNNKRDQAVL